MCETEDVSKKPLDFEIKVLGSKKKVGAACYAYIKHLADGTRQIILIDFGSDPSKFLDMEDGEGNIDTKVLPDLEWIKENQNDIIAIFFTHGHMDHIGGVKFLPEELIERVAIFVTPFTATLLQDSYRGFRGLGKELANVTIFDAELLEPIEVGVFKVIPFPVPHSIPDACGYMIETRDPIKKVVHITDFKFNGQDHKDKMRLTKTLGEIGRHIIDTVVIEVLNSRFDGYTPQENLVFETIFNLVETIPDDRRVIITHFASNVYRMKAILDIGRYTNKKFAMDGTAMKKFFKYGKEHEYIDRGRHQTFANNAKIILVTGSQGEPQAILAKAVDDLIDLEIDENDVVLFSSNVIPGNEDDFVDLVLDIEDLGATVYVDQSSDFENFDGLDIHVVENLHVSGHGNWLDKKRAIELIRPQKNILMVHGEETDEDDFLSRIDELKEAEAKSKNGLFWSHLNVISSETGSVLV